MKAGRVIALLTALLLLLAGCSLPNWVPREVPFELPFDLPWTRTDSAGEGQTVTVYRLTNPAAAGGELLGQEQYTLPEGADALETAIALLAAPSGTGGLTVALRSDVAVEDWYLDNGTVTLVLSETFLALSDIQKAAAAFCAVMTLTALDGVEAVTVTAGDQVVFSGLIPADALLNLSDGDPYTRQLRLYFADSDGRYLVSEYHTLALDEDASLERYVVEELLRGPNSRELQSAIPAGTELLSCRTEDGVCTVDLSEPFYNNRPDTALGERLAVYSIVNSLTVLSQVDSVVLLVEGRPVGTYVLRSLDAPLTRHEGALGNLPEDWAVLDIDLYLPLPGLEDVTALPWLVDMSEYDSAPEAVLAALLAAAEPGYPTLFSGSGTVMGVTVNGAACVVDLSESFFASLPAEARTTAVRSIAATLCQLETVDRVSFTIGGGPALFDGVDWSGPWTLAELVN